MVKLEPHEIMAGFLWGAHTGSQGQIEYEQSWTDVLSLQAKGAQRLAVQQARFKFVISAGHRRTKSDVTFRQAHPQPSGDCYLRGPAEPRFPPARTSLVESIELQFPRFSFESKGNLE